MTEHSRPDPAGKPSAYATVLVLDAERRTCPHCGPDGLCTPLKQSFRQACNIIAASRRDQAVAA